MFTSLFCQSLPSRHLAFTISAISSDFTSFFLFFYLSLLLNSSLHFHSFCLPPSPRSLISIFAILCLFPSSSSNISLFSAIQSPLPHISYFISLPHLSPFPFSLLPFFLLCHSHFFFFLNPLSSLLPSFSVVTEG